MKTLTKNKILITLLIALMAFCSILGITSLLPRIAKAEEVEKVDTSTYIESALDKKSTPMGGHYYRAYLGITPEQYITTIGQVRITFNETGAVLACSEDYAQYITLNHDLLKTVAVTDTCCDFYIGVGVIADVNITSPGEEYSHTFDTATAKFEERAFDWPEEGENYKPLYILSAPPITASMTEIEYDGTPVAGRYFRFYCASSDTVNVYFDGFTFSVMSDGTVRLIQRNGDDINMLSLAEDSVAPEVINYYKVEKGDINHNVFDIYFPAGQVISSDDSVSFDMSSVSDITIDTYGDTAFFYELVSSVAEEPETPGDSTGSGEAEKENDKDIIAGVGDWFVQAGDDVSSWLGDNAGVSIAGSSVLVIAAVALIAYAVTHRKKKR